MNPRNYTIYIVTITVLVLIAFGVLQYLHLPVGTLVDWVIGIAAFWWFLGITTNRFVWVAT
jgi:hypothetical protein